MLRRMLLSVIVLSGLLPLPSAVSAQSLRALLVGDESAWAQWGQFQPNIQMDMGLMFAVLTNHVPEDRLTTVSLTIGEASAAIPSRFWRPWTACRTSMPTCSANKWRRSWPGTRGGPRCTVRKNDLALDVSYAFNDYQRAGDSSRGVVVVQELDTVDASDLDTDLLGHSYYGDAVRLLDDVKLLFRQNLPPPAPERHLQPKSTGEGLE